MRRLQPLCELGCVISCGFLFMSYPVYPFNLGVSSLVKAGLRRQEERREGQQEGREQGLQEAQARILLRQLERRFGPIPDAVKIRVSEADSRSRERRLDLVLDAPTIETVFEGDRDS